MFAFFNQAFCLLLYLKKNWSKKFGVKRVGVKNFGVKKFGVKQFWCIKISWQNWCKKVDPSNILTLSFLHFHFPLVSHNLAIILPLILKICDEKIPGWTGQNRNFSTGTARIFLMLIMILGYQMFHKSNRKIPTIWCNLVPFRKCKSNCHQRHR